MIIVHIIILCFIAGGHVSILSETSRRMDVIAHSSSTTRVCKYFNKIKIGRGCTHTTISIIVRLWIYYGNRIVKLDVQRDVPFKYCCRYEVFCWKELQQLWVALMVLAALVWRGLKLHSCAPVRTETPSDYSSFRTKRNGRMQSNRTEE